MSFERGGSLTLSGGAESEKKDDKAEGGKGKGSAKSGNAEAEFAASNKQSTDESSIFKSFWKGDTEVSTTTATCYTIDMK